MSDPTPPTPPRFRCSRQTKRRALPMPACRPGYDPASDPDNTGVPTSLGGEVDDIGRGSSARCSTSRSARSSRGAWRACSTSSASSRSRSGSSSTSCRDRQRHLRAVVQRRRRHLAHRRDADPGPASSLPRDRGPQVHDRGRRRAHRDRGEHRAHRGAHARRLHPRLTPAAFRRTARSRRARRRARAGPRHPPTRANARERADPRALRRARRAHERALRVLVEVVQRAHRPVRAVS